MTDDPAGYSTVPRLAEIAGLVHGFGGAGWSEADFLAFAASRDLRPVIMRQVHSDTVHRLDEAPAGKLDGDALMTNAPGLLLVIRTADCLPVFLVDAKNRAAAAVHCGWRGTEKRILEKAAEAMGRAYGSEPGAMLAALGPCIGSACYEVGPEVREGFRRAGFPPSVFTKCQEREEAGTCPKGPGKGPLGRVPAPLRPAVLDEAPGRPGKSLLDLRAANVWLLHELGFRKDNILDSGSACTHCEPSLLSYRRNPGDFRRMYNFIGFS
ncbi:MAG: laccase domain-containing protein [Acidobacteria bacterium]|nr:laccase domain-containing protein [Acidobacteriota bacterium]